MTNQDIFSLWSQINTDILVFLGRPSVQLQLAVVIVAVLAAAVLGRAAQNWWRVRYRHQIKEAGFGQRLIYYLVFHLVSGFLAVAFIQLAKVILAGQGARTGLIDSLLRLVVLYLMLKAALAVAVALGDIRGIQKYQTTLIIPLFVVIIGVQFLYIFIRSDQLANVPVFNLFDNTVTLSALFLITAGFYLWVVGIYALGQGIHFLATHYGSADPGSTQATLTLLRYLLIIIGLGYVLYRLNFNTTTIAAISGGLSVGVGFALSTILSNFVSGILLLFERTLRPGDIIEFNGELSTVDLITIRSIRVRTLDNVEKIIPNSEFVTSSFTTYTGKSRHVRIKLLVGASYDDDYRQVMQTLLEIAAAHPNVMRDPAPDVRVENFGDFSIDYYLYVWIANPLLSGRVKNELHQSILDAFADKGITIPFPTATQMVQFADKA
ncbi:MAG: hypothetical protein D6768_10935 [Chloroflexi bacterium]|nr:MAG: hypothetical protein D6768_10935 [Chloroflexota bacterium]